MNKKTGVILADGDEAFRALLCDALERSGEFTVYASVNDGVSALAAMEEHKDAVLLLELTLPRLDGLGVLDALQSKGCTQKAIVLSAQSRAHTVQRAMDKGAYYYIVKPCDLSSVLMRVREAAKAEEYAAQDVPAELEWAVASALSAVGMPPNNEGTMLARNMLILAVKDRRLLRRPIRKNLFSRVLRDENDTVDNVDRALRAAVESAWKDGDWEFQNFLFGATVKKSGRPTNADFITVMAGYVDLSLRYRAQHGADGTTLRDWVSMG